MSIRYNPPEREVMSDFGPGCDCFVFNRLKRSRVAFGGKYLGRPSGHEPIISSGQQPDISPDPSVLNRYIIVIEVVKYGYYAPPSPSGL
jgi:hypothetical protein